MTDSSFDWVTARFHCSPGQVFEKLKLQIKADIDTRNGLLRETQRVRYTFAMSDTNGSFTVLTDGAIHHTVTFRLVSDGIEIKDDSDKAVHATLTINDEGECVAKINGQERNFWQLRKMALEDLFFRQY